MEEFVNLFPEPLDDTQSLRQLARPESLMSPARLRNIFVPSSAVHADSISSLRLRTEKTVGPGTCSITLLNDGLQVISARGGDSAQLKERRRGTPGQ